MAVKARPFRAVFGEGRGELQPYTQVVLSEIANNGKTQERLVDPNMMALAIKGGFSPA
jgi:hypothetical protein